MIALFHCTDVELTLGEFLLLYERTNGRRACSGCGATRRNFQSVFSCWSLRRELDGYRAPLKKEETLFCLRSISCALRRNRNCIFLFLSLLVVFGLVCFAGIEWKSDYLSHFTGRSRGAGKKKLFLIVALLCARNKVLG